MNSCIRLFPQIGCISRTNIACMRTNGGRIVIKAVSPLPLSASGELVSQAAPTARYSRRDASVSSSGSSTAGKKSSPGDEVRSLDRSIRPRSYPPGGSHAANLISSAVLNSRDALMSISSKKYRLAVKDSLPSRRMGLKISRAELRNYFRNGVLRENYIYRQIYI